ncbi:hypothetical protein PAMA_004991 [Pampus argenteus]
MLLLPRTFPNPSSRSLCTHSLRKIPKTGETDATQQRSVECHGGNKQQQQLSRMGLIKYSFLALQPVHYCNLDQSRPDWPCRHHDHQLPLQVNARKEEELDATFGSLSLLCAAAVQYSRRLGNRTMKPSHRHGSKHTSVGQPK